MKADRLAPKVLQMVEQGNSYRKIAQALPADPQTRYPICLTGKRACPPEDCGEVWGYASFLEAIRSPDHPDHEAMLEWVGGEFDSEIFDLDAVNRMLRQIR